MGDVAEMEIELVNCRGLHARASARLARLAGDLAPHITIQKDGHSVTASSIMGLLMLGAAYGDSVVVRAEGDGANDAVDRVALLFSTRFGEEK